MIGKLIAALCAALILAASPVQAQMTDAQKMERNKKNVVEFYNAVLNEKNYEKAITYIGATYIQHNPNGADGPEGIKGFINSCARNFPTTRARSSASSPTAIT